MVADGGVECVKSAYVRTCPTGSQDGQVPRPHISAGIRAERLGPSAPHEGRLEVVARGPVSVWPVLHRGTLVVLRGPLHGRGRSCGISEPSARTCSLPAIGARGD